MNKVGEYDNITFYVNDNQFKEYKNTLEERLEDSIKREKEWKEAYMKAMKNWGKCINHNRKLQQKIDKSIEHLHKRNEQNNSALTNKEETIISKHELLKLEIINNKILEDILRGNNE